MNNQNEFKEISAALIEEDLEKDDSLCKDEQLDINQMEIIRSLKSLLELKEGHNESLADITTVINQAIPNCDPFNIHTCLVKAFPDLQAQQSTDSNEIYYLGIQFTNNVATEEKVIEWLQQRFCEDEFGSVSCKTIMDIIHKELGQITIYRLGVFVRKAFPKVYLRRSDRLRWYCGITLPEKELSEEEKDGKIWLSSACEWLRNNMVKDSMKREKCSFVYSALSQFIGKTNGEKYMSAVKVVFPDVQKKNIAHQAFYDGIRFIDDTIREQIKDGQPKKFKRVDRFTPLLTESEADVVDWLKTILDERDGHREKIKDIANLLSKKYAETITEKTTLVFLRKAFCAIAYRKRNGISYVYGLDIKSCYRPKDTWSEKAIAWVKKIIRPTLNTTMHKLQKFIDILKPALCCTNQAKCCRILLLAFPNAVVRKTDNSGRLISGIDLNENYQLISRPIFNEEDLYGDVTDISFDDGEFHNDEKDEECNGDEDNTSCSFEGNDVNDSNTVDESSHDHQVDFGVNDQSKRSNEQLEKKIDLLTTNNNDLQTQLAEMKEDIAKSLEETNNIFNNMAEEIKSLRQDLNQSTHQRDTLIIQLQQTLMLLSQQQYQKIMKQTLPQTPQQLSTTSNNGLQSSQEMYDSGDNMMTMQALQNLHDNGMNKQL